MKVLEITDLCKEYPGFRLKNVSFYVESGQIMGFIGRNGAGKTTAMKAALNLVHPSKGRVTYFGMDFAQEESAIKQRIGFATGTLSYYKKKPIGTIVGVTRQFYETWDEAAWRHYAQAFKLDESKTPEQLSQGMKVKFNIALALSHGAELLILDEPTSGLDPVSREELLDVFLQLKKKGVAILFSTHITSDLEKCADAITYIKDGEILDSCSLQEFMAVHAEQGATLQDIMTTIEKEVIEL